MSDRVERRSFELRADGNNFEIAARAIKYNAISQDLGGFVERVSPGAFTESIKRGDEIVCLVNHQQSEILGRTRNGSLEIEDSPDALRFRCKLNRAIQAHRDLYEMVKSGLISECSFAFTVDDQEWDNSHKPPLRTIKRGTLYDLSVVVSPAYANGATSAEARLGTQRVLQTHGASDAAKTLRRAAQIIARELRSYLARRGDFGDQADFASQLQRCHELSELCHAYACQADDVLQSTDDDELNDEAMNDAFRTAHEATRIAAANFASARLRHQRRLSEMKAAKALGRGVSDKGDKQ